MPSLGLLQRYVYPRSYHIPCLTLSSSYTLNPQFTLCLIQSTYSPFEYTAPAVLAGPEWADAMEVPVQELLTRSSYEGDICIDASKRPRNPIGRTGMRGRGLLGKWGPNHAADPVVLRSSSSGGIQVVVIRRGDIGVWALPGGKWELDVCVYWGIGSCICLYEYKVFYIFFIVKTQCNML